MTIEQNIASIKAALPADVKLVAVSKTFPAVDISAAYGCGQRAFGENRTQELKAKHEELPEDIEWHFIGSLQTNKIKYISPYVSLIHSVDSARLLEAIDTQAAKCGRTIDVLFEFHAACETTKHGWSEEELLMYAEGGEALKYSNVRIRGLMTMASFTDDTAIIRDEFRRTRRLFERLGHTFGDSFDTLSMGMSGDYHIAVDEGSTLVRIGSSIFGNR